jgi:hypothetical protein
VDRVWLASDIAEVAYAKQSHWAAHSGKSAQEPGSGESHDALLIAASIVFPSKSHAVTMDAEQALIATRQVFFDLLRE